MSWKAKLLDASYRGVSFNVESESSTIGRRVETHEYPNRDKPYSEDLGKVTARPCFTAYVIGDDCFEQRDRLIDALNVPGPGMLIHPVYGELKVCVDGEIRVSTSSTEGRMVRFELRFVEAGELSFPSAGVATAQTLMSSCSALENCIGSSFDRFGLEGMADFIHNDVIDSATGMMKYVSGAMKVVDASIADAARLLQGDLSVLLPPPSSGKTFVDQLRSMWRMGNRLSGNVTDTVTMIKTLSGVSRGHDLAPRGIWKTDSVTTQLRVQQSNVISSAIRTTAISEAAYAVTRITALVPQAGLPQQTSQVGWPQVTHPALNSATATTAGGVQAPTWDALVAIRDTLNQAIDKEMLRSTDDALFLALRRVKADINIDISRRLKQIEKTQIRTPSEVLPALVLAATWYDNAARDSDITHRNAIVHSGFVPVKPLRVPTR